MKNILIVSCPSPVLANFFTLSSALRSGITAEGCAVEHLVWTGAEHSLDTSCTSCQMEENCSEADDVAIAVQRLKAADAVIFLVGEDSCESSSALLPLVRTYAEDERCVDQPRFLVLVSGEEMLLGSVMTELLVKATSTFALGWAGLTILCGGNLEQAKMQAQAEGSKIAKKMMGLK